MRSTRRMTTFSKIIMRMYSAHWPAQAVHCIGSPTHTHTKYFKLSILAHVIKHKQYATMFKTCLVNSIGHIAALFTKEAMVIILHHTTRLKRQANWMAFARQTHIRAGLLMQIIIIISSQASEEALISKISINYWGFIKQQNNHHCHRLLVQKHTSSIRLMFLHTFFFFSF